MTFLATSGVATLGGRVRRFEAPILPIAVFEARTKGTPARRAWLPSAPRAVTGRRVMAVLQSVLMAGSLLILSTAADVLAGPITGSNQAEPALSEPGPGAPAEVDDLNDTVIVFTVTPADDPTQMQTIILLEQSGGRRVCVNLKSTDVITRAYRTLDDPFRPSIPGEIRGTTTGDTGNLIDWNETNVFIRPHTPEDTFTNLYECFVATEAEGCFLPVEDSCYQLLKEGDVARVLETISLAGFSVLDHAGLARQLRILIALNQPEATIITAADITLAAVVEAAALPSASQATTDQGRPPPPPSPQPIDTGGTGGGEPLASVAVLNVLVPNVIGETEGVAMRLIIAAGLTGGFIVRPARADEIVPTECVAGTVVSQSTSVSPGDPVLLVLCPQAADIPEPSSLALFATGLGLLILLTWWRRRSS